MRVIGDTGVVMFGMLSGFTIVTSMNGERVTGSLRFYESRLVPIQLIYLISCGFCVINKFASCQPGDYGPYVWGSVDACRATLLDLSYWGTWSLSAFLMVFLLQAWPIGVFVWHINYYGWFMSCYQSCILLFPCIHRLLHDKAKRGRKVLYATHASLQVVHFLTLVFMEATYLTLKSKQKLEAANYFIWAGYMFPPVSDSVVCGFHVFLC